MGLWKRLFKLVSREIDSGSGSWGESYWLWENDLFYTGGETVKIWAPSDMIESMVTRLENVNPRTLSKIKRVFIRHVRSQFRGSKWVDGYIEGDKEFLGRLVIKAYWKWKDIAWNWGGGDLIIDGEFLERLRWEQDIEKVYKSSNENEGEAET
jgi:hypothetical protein